MDVVEGLAHKRRLPISTLCHCSPRLITLRISPQMCTTKISLATHTHKRNSLFVGEEAFLPEQRYINTESWNLLAIFSQHELS